MSENGKPVLLVDPLSDPLLVRIDGRGSFQNSASLRDFVNEMIERGRRRFVIDFRHCSSMDSTFLGVLAGMALTLRRADPPGSVVLTRLAPRNLELVFNLGLHRLLTVDAGEQPELSTAQARVIDSQDRSEIDRARLVLEAHENLVEADASNLGRFQDVLQLLRRKVSSS